MAGIFKAYDIRGVYGEELTDEIAYWIGLGLASQVFSEGNTILVSRDARTHSNKLNEKLIQGLTEGGCNVLDIGLAATPMNYWANVTYEADGSVMITASHNPAKYNGFKVSAKGAVPIDHKSGLYLIEEFVNNKQAPSKKPMTKGSVKTKDSAQVLKEYLAFTKKFITPQALSKKLKIAVDSANGMAGCFLKDFFAMYSQNNIEIVDLYWDIDGSFPNHEADPVKPKNLEALQKAVKENNCDFGIGFDGDADRGGFVDENGTIVSSDLITALIGEYYLDQNPGCAILYDLRSSQVVYDTILAKGGKPVRSRVGHSFMKRLLKEQNGKFGGELSGHYYFADCFYTDSALMALVQVINILSEKKEKLSTMIDKFRKYCPTGEISFKVQDAQGVLEKLERQYANNTKTYKIDKLDGLTVEGQDWWFNLRASNTEPLLRLNLEAKTQDVRDDKLEEVKALIQ